MYIQIDEHTYVYVLKTDRMYSISIYMYTSIHVYEYIHR